MSSNRPYLVRAMYDWISDNGFTPYLLVDARIAGVRADVAIKLFGDDLEQLLKSGDAINDVAASIPGAEEIGRAHV